WYSCVNNLKTVKNHRMGFLFAVESNRLVSIEKGQWSQVKQLDVPDDGLTVWLRQFGEVKLFRTRLKDQLRHYVVYLPDENDYPAFDQQAFIELHDQHWQIEQYHRMIKQVCNIERFQVRRRLSIQNHIFAAICGFVHLRQMQLAQLFDNAYQWQRELFTEVVAGFVSEFVQGKEHLNPQFCRAVNA
ncbi:MAG: transposase, partial [Thiolinea sp.]